MASVVVTGGAGFVGSHLVDALIRRGESVVVLDNLVSGCLANLGPAIETGRVTLIYTDVATTAAALRSTLSEAGVRSIKAIYHLASPSCPDRGESDTWERLSSNVEGTAALVDIAVEKRARFVFASTTLLSPHDAAPNSGGHGDATPALSLYAQSKQLGEATVAAAVRERRLDGRVIRFAGCYGPRMAKTDALLVPSLIESAINRRPLVIDGDGLQKRWLSYVADAVVALLLVGDHPKGALPAIDVGPDDALSIIAIAEVVAAHMAHSPVFEYRDVATPVPHRRPDVRRARSLGWTAVTPFRAGLQHTYDWFATESKLFV